MKIKEVFVEKLKTIYHSRIAYPKDETKRSKEQSDELPKKSPSLSSSWFAGIAFILSSLASGAMKPIFLIGFMGAGKSTLGKLLAQELMFIYRP